MSKCISNHGEYGEHTLDPVGEHRFICRLCWVFDEDEALAALARAEARVTAALDLAALLEREGLRQREGRNFPQATTSIYAANRLRTAIQNAVEAG